VARHINKKMCHVQLDCYVKGMKNSKFLTLRFPYVCGRGGSGGAAAAEGGAIPGEAGDGGEE
jgi:hypothetical protein